MIYSFVIVLGLVIGSFLNVCIYRMPLGKSVVWPRSFCPFCENTIRWYDNIPLLSFILLRGKCRYCSRAISLRYFIVELITALTGLILLSRYSIAPHFFIYWLFSCALIVVTFIDIEHQEIPDIISLPGIILGLAVFTVFRMGRAGTYAGSALDSLAGVLAGGGSMFLLGMFGELIFRKEALGGGDVKLMGMIGAFIGWKFVLLTFFLAPILGSAVGIFLKIKFRKEVIPYGPYLSLGALISLLCGENIINYLFFRY